MAKSSLLTLPDGVTLRCDENGPLADDVFGGIANDTAAQSFMELVEPDDGTQVLAWYDYPAWNRYAAITRNRFGSGWAQWIGTMTSSDAIWTIFDNALSAAGIREEASDLAGIVTVRRGMNELGEVRYLLNYAPQPVSFISPWSGVNLLAGASQEDSEQVADDGNDDNTAVARDTVSADNASPSVLTSGFRLLQRESTLPVV